MELASPAADCVAFLMVSKCLYSRTSGLRRGVGPNMATTLCRTHPMGETLRHSGVRPGWVNLSNHRVPLILLFGHGRVQHGCGPFGPWSAAVYG